MKVYLDNIPVQNLNTSLENPVFTLRRKDENGTAAYSFSGDLTFIETDYDYLYLKLKTDPNARINKVVLKFVDDCCSSLKEYKFEINHESLLWCEGKCELTASAIEKSLDNEAITCLKNTLIYDNWNGFQQKKHPRMVYCNELRPNWLQHFVILASIQLGFLLLVLTPILAVLIVMVAIINAIVNAVNAIIPGDGPLNTIDFDNDPSTNVFQETKNAWTTMMSYVIGCGRKHPSPLVRDYAANVCGKCGLNFVSSIFNDPNSSRYNSVWVNAPVHKGTSVNDTTTFWVDENKPIENGITFFDKLKSITNGDYKVKNGNLIFERKDLLNPLAIPFLDLTQFDSTDLKVCWSWENKYAYSYASFKYGKDAINWVGSEAMPRWDDIVEWNNPYNPNQKDVYEPLIPFSACRYRNDGIEPDILTYYQNFPFIGPIIKQTNNAILMNSHNCYSPMIMVWDTKTGVDNASVSGADAYFPSIPNVGLNQFFNYPYWFKENYPGNLYTDFFYIENPKLTGFKGLSFTADIKMSCEIKDSLDIDGSIMTSEGISKDIKEIIINFKTGIITIKGTV